jgi:UDP-2,3-diacylglucosamine hydrolase
MKAVFFSDAHLTDNDHEKLRTIVNLVREVSNDADEVFFLGDLFEFYHGYDDHAFPFFREVIEVLREIASRRTVYFLEGNHEFGMGHFFESYTGVKCVETLAINLDGKKVFVSHGDEIGSPILRRILKSRFIYSVMDMLGPSTTWKIAMACRPVLSKNNKVYSAKTRDRFRKYGARKLREGYDAVVLAHSHIPDKEEHQIEGRSRVYINTGDLERSLTYGEYVSGEGFTVRTWASADGRRSKNQSKIS